MTLKITFPKAQAFEAYYPKYSLYSLFNLDQFSNRIRNLCLQQFNDKSVFEFSIEQKNKRQWLLKCPKNCPAYLLYECEDYSNEQNTFPIYKYKSSHPVHYHPIKEFRNLNFNFLKPYLPDPEIISFPSFNNQGQSKGLLEKYRTIIFNPKNRQKLLEDLRNDWGRGSISIFHCQKKCNGITFSVRCRLSFKTHNQLKCGWKMIWKRPGATADIQQSRHSQFESENSYMSKQKDVLMQFCPKLSNLQHIHYALTSQTKNEHIGQALKKSPFEYVSQKRYKTLREREYLEKEIIAKQINQEKGKKGYAPKNKYKYTDRKEELESEDHGLFQSELINDINNIQPVNIAIQSLNVYSSYHKFSFDDIQTEKTNISTLLSPLLEKLDAIGFDYRHLSEENCGTAMKSLINCIQNKELYVSVDKPQNQPKYSECKSYQISLNSQFQQVQKTDDARDFQDIVIISSKLMRYLGRSYGDVVHVTERKLGQQSAFGQQKPTVILSCLIFNGYNFNQDAVYLSMALCKNITPQKRLKIFYLMFKYYLTKLKTLVLEDKSDSLIDTAESIRKQLKLTYEIITIPKRPKGLYQSGYSYQSQFSNYEAIAQNKTKFVKRNKVSGAQKNELQPIQIELGPQYLTNSYLGLSEQLWKDPRQTLALTERQAFKKLNEINLISSERVRLYNIMSFHEHVDHLAKRIKEKNAKWCHRHKLRHQVQSYYKVPQLSSCRKLLSKFVFGELTGQLSQAQKSNIIVNTNSFCVVDDGISANVVEIKKVNHSQTSGYIKIYELKTHFNYENDNINSVCVCQCGFKDRSGIPCSHMLKVMLQKKISILQSFKLSKVVNLAIVKPRIKGYFRDKKRG